MVKFKIDRTFVIGSLIAIFGFFILVITSFFLSDIGFHQRRCDSDVQLPYLTDNHRSHLGLDNNEIVCENIRIAIAGAGISMVAALIQIGSFALVWLKMWTIRLLLHCGVILLLIIACSLTGDTNIHLGNVVDTIFFALIVLDLFFCAGTGIAIYCAWKKQGQAQENPERGSVLKLPMVAQPEASGALNPVE